MIYVLLFFFANAVGVKWPRLSSWFRFTPYFSSSSTISYRPCLIA